MAIETIFVLAAGDVTVSGGLSLSGLDQGTGVHLLGQTITLNNNGWQAVSINDNDALFDDNDSSQTLNGTQTIGGVTYTDGRVVENEYALTLRDDSTGILYRVVAFNIREPDPVTGNTFGTVEGLAFVASNEPGFSTGFPPIGTALTVIENFEFPSDPYASFIAPPCFTSGTRLLTPDGYRPVDDLAVGDWVKTMDHGPQQIRWIGVARMPKAVLVTLPKFRPVTIRKDAFGIGQPACDLQVSPQHRVLVTGWQAELLFGETDILVPATKLVNDRDILCAGAEDDVIYYHVMFDRHEIIWADGLASESFLPGGGGADVATDAQAELDALFPHMAPQWAQRFTARPCISDKRTQVLRDSRLSPLR